MDTPQEVDPRTGFYYVSVVDGPRHSLLSGPYTDHSAALAHVEPVRTIANRVDLKSHFYGFGTCRSETDQGQGILNKHGLFNL